MTSKVESRTGGAMLGALSGATSSESESPPTHWLLCQAGAHQFALPVPQVIETMRMLPIESLAGAPPMVRGLSVIRGAPTPVVDSALMFDDQPADCERLVTVRTGDRTIAFATESVLGVRTIAANELQRLPPLLSNVQTIAAMKTLDEQLVFFLQVARVVPEHVLDRCLAEGMQA
jgi:purine-binding chemotaxis protein CheW